MTKLAASITLLCFLCMHTVTVQGQLFQLLSPKQTNIKFTNRISETENLNVLAYEYFYNGAGVAVGDINNDGLEDIFLVSNMNENKLYLNSGNLRFKDITASAAKELGGRSGGWKTGVTMADVNGDGWLDIYICYSGKVTDDQRRNQLFINLGNGHFSEQAAAYGLNDKSYSTQAAFFDYDNDGDLDMFLLNHSTKKIDNMELARYRDEVDELAGNKLYENTNNHFTDVSKKAGIRQNPLTFGLGIAVADINKDGWQDVYVTNDYNEPDYMYINNGNGTFTNKADVCLRYLSQFSMGIDIADFNNDALPDIITLDMLPEDNRRQKLLQLQENYESFALMINQGLNPQYMRNMLQLNNGDGMFSEVAQLAGISNTDWSWCPLFADYDNDGYKDLFITNGYLRDYTNKDFLRYWGDYKVKKAIDREPVLLMDLVQAMPSTTIANYIFRNNHDGTFSNRQKQWGVDQPAISNSAVYADLDNDGDLELVVNNINENVFVYKNTSRETGGAGYLSLRLRYKNPNSHALGSKIWVYTGNNVQYAEVNPTRGYLSCVSTVLHFGLPKATAIDSVKILWPDHSVQVLKQVAANKLLSVDYAATGPANVPPVVNPTRTIFTKAGPVIDYKHEGVGENDFKRQLLMLFMYSQTGPVMAKGDVNKDGLEDLFVGGDKNKPARIYIQKPGGQFYEDAQLSVGDETNTAVAAAVFFDADGNGYQDLYVAKGGYSLYEPHTPALQDELYLNNGKGKLERTTGFLPDLSAGSKSCARPCDYDNDGDIDLFIGGRVIPGKYPLPPLSYLLINDGKGHFTVANAFGRMGMVTDAQWIDIDKDGRKDLAVCGEFMPITVLMNTANGFMDKTSFYFDNMPNGFWFTLAVADIDKDGQEDLIAGNLGLNSCIHVSDEQPGELYFADFDNNGSIDPFFNFYVQGTSYPFVSRDELNEQIYPMRKKFTSYAAYANATMKDIFTTGELEKAGKLSVQETRTQLFIRRNGKFAPAALPMQAQFSVVNRVLARDFTGDGAMDLLLLGNHSQNRLKLGSINSGYGCLLTGDGKGGFNYVQQPESGLCIIGDVKSAVEITVDKTTYLAVGIGNDALQFYKAP